MNIKILLFFIFGTSFYKIIGGFNDCYYSPQGYTCPCENNPCGVGNTCTETENFTYDCVCTAPGYDFDGVTCSDLNECNYENGGCSQNCQNVPGSSNPVCSCNGGYTLSSDGKTCVDNDECALGSSGCSQGCTNTPGSYQCFCNSGFSMTNDGKTCVSNCLNNKCQGSCVPESVGYSCTCPGGTTVSGFNCNDIDECATTSLSGCSQGCTNSYGSYQCYCNSGYTLSSDGKTCVDNNECALGTSGCSQGCTNTPGSYNCYCNGGYTLSSNGKSCVDNCQGNNCEGSCTSLTVGYQCSCASGYTLSGNSYSCVDNNECTLGTSGCSQGCTNTPGSYSCYCNSGYTLNQDGRTCKYDGAVDPCSGNLCKGICNPVGTTGYQCSCASGYVLSGSYDCVDINECSDGISGCSQGCVNSQGGFLCTCNSGFSLSSDGKTCVDNCQGNNCEGSCTSLTVGYQCSCASGYTLAGNSYSCNDNNECSDGSSGCSQSCTNTPGSYHCTCGSDYVLNADGKTCDYITGCSTGNGGCEQICTPLTGSSEFQCSCNSGFTINGKNCDDIDECNPVNPCPTYSKCSNSNGSYVCVYPQQHYISSIKPSTTDGGTSQFYGNFGNEHQDISLKIGGADCNITYISLDLINCTSLPGVGKHSVNLTQNGIAFTSIEFVYETIGNKICKNDCTNELQGSCNILTSECICKDGWNGFDCSQKSMTGGSGTVNNSTIPITNITITNGETNIENQEVNFSIYFKSLNEIDYTGKTIKSYTLKNNWVSTTNEPSSYKFIQKLQDSNCTVETTIEELKQDKQFNFADTTFTVLKGLVKFTISIKNYQYSSSLNTLQLELVSMVAPQIDSNFNNDCNNNDTQIETNNLDEQSSFFNYIKISKNNKIFSARILNRIVSDGKSTFLSSTIKNETDSIIVVLNLPHCVTECLIDPDFSVLVSSDFKSKCDSSKSNRKWVIPVSVVLSVCGAAALVVAGFISYKKSTVLKVKVHKLKRFSFKR